MSVERESVKTVGAIDIERSTTMATTAAAMPVATSDTLSFSLISLISKGEDDLVVALSSSAQQQ